MQIGYSEIQFQNVLVMTQIQGLRKLIIHDTIISYSATDVAKMQDQLLNNYSIKEFAFYKNRLCSSGMQTFFDTVLPLMVSIDKLKLPSNYFKDSVIDHLT